MLQKSLFTLLLILLLPLVIMAKEPWNNDHQFRRAYIVDPVLSALRRSPSSDGYCLKRLRLGRSLYIVSTTQNRQGVKYYYVAVTRRTRGYIDAASVIIPGVNQEDSRLMRIINSAAGIEKIMLCQMLAAKFPHSKYLPEVLILEGKTAEKLAKELSHRATIKPPTQYDPELDEARYWENYAGLDRFNRLDLHFISAGKDGSYRYDGAAYRKLLAKFPKSDFAEIARTRLAEIEGTETEITSKVRP